jgi:hypothetical protein
MEKRQETENQKYTAAVAYCVHGHQALLILVYFSLVFFFFGQFKTLNSFGL